MSGLGAGGVVALQYWQQSANAQKWAPFLASTELAYGIPTNLLARMAFQESSYEQDIIDGTRASPAGALGLMQLEPQYFDTVRRPIPFTDTDTQDQITQAAQDLVQQYARFGSWALALAAYNAGAEPVAAAGPGIPPYVETQNYVAKILADVPAAASA